MSATREELAKSAMEKMGLVIRALYTSCEYPLGEAKIGGQQIRIVFHLARNREGATVKELAQMLRVTSGAVTQFINVLFDKGLVRREENPDDRRSMRVKLSEKALSGFDAFKEHYFETVDKAFSPLHDDEMQRLASLLEKVQVDR
jgi:DNA-binding MarR family transcriptional regulator